MSDLSEHIAYQQSYQLRLQAVKDMIEMEAAQRDGAAFRMLIDALNKEEFSALTALVDCNPAEVGKIAQIQAQARVARTVRDSIQDILYRGQVAEQSLRDEDTGRI